MKGGFGALEVSSDSGLLDDWCVLRLATLLAFKDSTLDRIEAWEEY